jgi:hypothetical protein
MWALSALDQLIPRMVATRANGFELNQNPNPNSIDITFGHGQDQKIKMRSEGLTLWNGFKSVVPSNKSRRLSDLRSNGPRVGVWCQCQSDGLSQDRREFVVG